MDHIVQAIEAGNFSWASSQLTAMINEREPKKQMLLLVVRSYTQQRLNTAANLSLAMADAQEAIRLAPEQALGYLQAGFVLTALSRLDEARDMFNQAGASCRRHLKWGLDYRMLSVRIITKLVASGRVDDLLFCQSELINEVFNCFKDGASQSITDVVISGTSGLHVYDPVSVMWQPVELPMVMQPIVELPVVNGLATEQVIDNWASQLNDITNQRSASKRPPSVSSVAPEQPKKKPRNNGDCLSSPTNLLGLNGLFIDGITESCASKRFQRIDEVFERFGRIVKTMCKGNKQVIIFNNSEAPTRAMAELNNKPADGLGNKLKMKFFPDRQQQTNSKGINGYNSIVRSFGECTGWRLNSGCNLLCGDRHDPVNFGVDYQPNPGILKDQKCWFMKS